MFLSAYFLVLAEYPLTNDLFGAVTFNDDLLLDFFMFLLLEDVIAKLGTAKVFIIKFWELLTLLNIFWPFSGGLLKFSFLLRKGVVLPLAFSPKGITTVAFNLSPGVFISSLSFTFSTELFCIIFSIYINFLCLLDSWWEAVLLFLLMPLLNEVPVAIFSFDISSSEVCSDGLELLFIYSLSKY